MVPYIPGPNEWHNQVGHHQVSQHEGSKTYDYSSHVFTHPFSSRQRHTTRVACSTPLVTGAFFSSADVLLAAPSPTSMSSHLPHAMSVPAGGTCGPWALGLRWIGLWSEAMV